MVEGRRYEVENKSIRIGKIETLRATSKYKMPQKKIIHGFMFLLALLLLAQTVYAQKLKPVVIEGTAEFAAGMEIRLMAYTDLLSYRQEVVATDKIGKDGSFRLSFPTRHIQLVQIAIRTSKAEFYVMPEQTYRFTIDMDPQLFQLIDPMEYGGFLQIKSEDDTPHDLNYKINRFEYISSDIIDFFAPNIIGDIGKTEFDSISTNIKMRFPIEYEPTNFYKSYLYYFYAKLEGMLLQKTPDSLYIKYLDNEYVLYDNPAYMSFLSGFYSNYLITSPRIGKELLIHAINEEGNFLSLFNTIGKDPLLVNERLRELAILINLPELYDEKEFNRKNILKILDDIRLSSHFVEHRTIAENLIFQLQQNRAGSTLPDVKLKEIGGSSFRFSDLKGKWVFVQFFNVQCSDCLREMMIIKELKAKYGDKIEFVSISLDFMVSPLLQFKEKYPQFDWHFVHFNNQFTWLDELEVNALPDNILLNPDGTISRRNGPDITRDLPLFLMRLFAPEEEQINPLDPHNRN